MNWPISFTFPNVILLSGHREMKTDPTHNSVLFFFLDHALELFRAGYCEYIARQSKERERQLGK